MELIASQAGFKFVDEPLHPENLFRAGLTESSDDSAWEALMPGPERRNVLQRYFQGIEQNRIHIGEPRFLSKFYRLFTNRIVYKILRCKDLIPWFQSEFDLQIIYLVRHPLACSVSRKKFPRLKLFLANEEYRESFLSPNQLELADRVVRDGDELQLGILDWCVQNRPALKLVENGEIEIFFYELLVSSPESQIDRLADRLGLTDKEKMLEGVNRASASTVQSDQTTQDAFAKQNEDLNNSFLLGKWRQRVTTEQESKAFELLEAFDVGFYQMGSDLPNPTE